MDTHWKALIEMLPTSTATKRFIEKYEKYGHKKTLDILQIEMNYHGISRQEFCILTILLSAHLIMLDKEIYSVVSSVGSDYQSSHSL